MDNYDNNILSYRDYIYSLSKKELRAIIMGNDEIAPLLTRDEPKISRPQLIWAINKLNSIKNSDIEFDYTEQQVDAIISLVYGLQWNKIYNYDWVRFDVKKPAFYIFVIFFFSGLYGIGLIIAKLF